MRLALTVALAVAPVAAVAAQGPTPGDPAPDWTLTVATREGMAAEPLTLSSLRGQPVVLAFFPRARTRGCTIQMETYRDRYQELFGDGVALIAISNDSAAVLASWARDADFPFRFAADVDGVAGRLYGTLREGRTAEDRVLFVINAEGRVTTVMRPFREIDPTAYDELKAAVAAARN